MIPMHLLLGSTSPTYVLFTESSLQGLAHDNLRCSLRVGLCNQTIYNYDGQSFTSSQVFNVLFPKMERRGGNENSVIVDFLNLT